MQNREKTQQIMLMKIAFQRRSIEGMGHWAGPREVVGFDKEGIQNGAISALRTMFLAMKRPI
jgi:hypothetical protein